MNRENLQKFINLHVYANQSCLVEFLLKQDFVYQNEELMESLEHPNFYHEEADADGERVQKEILQWFLVSDWLAEKLEDIGEGILRLHGACWWGRTQCGIALTEDSAMIRVFENLHRFIFKDFKYDSEKE